MSLHLGDSDPKAARWCCHHRNRPPLTSPKEILAIMKIVLILSGGMDSTVLLYDHVAKGDDVRAIGVDYGQRHSRELLFASANCAKLGVPFQVVDISSVAALLPGSSQTDRTVDVPLGHYAEDNMKKTVVPNRNMIMLSIAMGHAIAHKFDAVSYAAHAGDHTIYPDCRPEFAYALGKAALLADWHQVSLQRPFINLTKADIVERGSRLGVDFAFTWSCYKGEEVHCGRCGTCIERREAFYLAGVKDPTVYHPDAPCISELVEKGWKV